MPISLLPVSTQTIITASLYNTIQNEAKYVLGTLYGGDPRTFNVTTSTTVTPIYWTNLAADVAQAYKHQTGNDLYFPLGKTPVTSGLIYADYVNAIISGTNFMSANTGTHAAGQMYTALETTGGTASRRTTSWGSTLTHHVKYTWTDSNEAKYFFNLGGSLIAAESYTPGSLGAGTTETQIMSMVDYVQARLASPQYQFTASNYYTNTPVSITTSANAFDSIEVSFAKVAANRVDFDITYHHLGWDSALDLTSTATYRTSIGSVPAEAPQVETTTFLGDAGTYVPFPTKTLAVSQPSTFTWYSNKKSPTQILYLTNNGTTDLTITDIQFSSNGGVTPHYSYGWGTSLPRIIGPGQTSTLNLYYTGTTLGTTQQTITIISNNDKGNKVLQFDCTAVAPLFEIYTLPDSWDATTASVVVQSQFFPVIPDGYDLAEFTATITGTGFKMDNNLTSYAHTGTVALLTSATGVNVLFNPSGLSTGTFYGTLNLSAISVNSLTSSTSVPLTVHYTAPENKNLGSWKSALAEYNAVIGASYDTVGGLNYITIGLTVGDQFTNPPPGGMVDLQLSDLGYLADDKYFEGTVLYKALPQPYYCDFLTQYGAWIRNDNRDPVNYNVKRKYAINVKTAGIHNWSFTADSYGYFSIDGTVLGDVRNETDPSQKEYTGTVDLHAGSHVLEFTAVNTGNGGSIGIKISNATDNSIVWSTLSPIRENPPYYGWGEVYRIPLDQGENLYRSFGYCIKDRQPAEGNRWGNFFASDGSIFSVFDDGYGNIDLYINPKSTRSSIQDVNTTLSNLPTLTYYYSPFGNRYSQLESQPIGNGSETHYFLGFDRFGNVRTSIVPVPTAAPDYSLYVANASSANGLTQVAQRAIAGVVEGALYSAAAESYNAYLISIGAEEGFIATTISEAVGSALFEAGIVESIVVGAEVAEGLGIIAIVAKIICTKLHELGHLPTDIYQADQDFGKKLYDRDPDAYNGYIAWAQTIVDWMDGKGNGPKMWKSLFWKKTEEEKISAWAKFAIKWTSYIARPWAEEMARQMGVRETSPTAGKFVMNVGLPISRLIGRWKRKLGDKKVTIGTGKGLAIMGVFSIITMGVLACNLFDKVKKK